MNMSGVADPIYVRARKVLLDALETLEEQRKAIVLVGAQAIYFHVGEADFAVAPYTEDADLALAPDLLLDEPVLAEAMEKGGFILSSPGIWRNADEAQVDLLVPQSLGGKGRRGARLGPIHGNKVARKVNGLEAALIDKTQHKIGSLDEKDLRQFNIFIAGPAALLVAKLHKISERINENDIRRIDNKDALDVLRLLRAIETDVLVTVFQKLINDSLAGVVTKESLKQLKNLFGTNDSIGTQMAVQSIAGLEDPDIISNSCTALASDLLSAVM